MPSLRATVAIGCACGVSALRAVPIVAPPALMTPQVAMTPALLPRQAPAPARVAGVFMQTDFYDEYVETDPVTGEKKTLLLDEKEKLYLECLDSFYNEDGKQLLSNEEYEQLKLDMDFDGSKVATYSKDEIRFVLANKRFKLGKPTLSDADYDTLRETLRKVGSLVVQHDGASCSVETGLCKTDLRVDAGKTRLLYLPGSLGGLLLTMEVIFWSVGLDPIFSALLGAIPAYFFGIWFTENVFAQKPLVATAQCPECNLVFNVFFGDLFSVQTDGIVGGVPPTDILECKCPDKKCNVGPLECDRSTMLCITKDSKSKKFMPGAA